MSVAFQLSNLLVLPFWVLLFVAPDARFTRRVFNGWWFIVPITTLYTVLVLPGFFQLLPTLMNPTLTAMSTLLSTPTGTTAAWTHFLAFDLWTGRWVYTDTQTRTIPGWVRTVCLACVFMAGPFGLLLYLLLRQRFPVSSDPSAAAAQRTNE